MFGEDQSNPELLVRLTGSPIDLSNAVKLCISEFIKVFEFNFNYDMIRNQKLEKYPIVHHLCLTQTEEDILHNQEEVSDIQIPNIVVMFNCKYLF